MLARRTLARDARKPRACAPVAAFRKLAAGGIVLLVATTVLPLNLAQASDDEPLTPADVVRIMAGRRPAIRAACFDAQGKQESSLRVDFVVGATGTVTDARPNDAKGPKPVIDCVLAEVRKTTFPSSTEGGAFQWPFVFKGP